MSQEHQIRAGKRPGRRKKPAKEKEPYEPELVIMTPPLPEPDDPPRRKPWETPGRLQCLELSPAVERLLTMGASRHAIITYCVTHGATPSQVDGLIKGIKEVWRANEATGREDRIAEYAAQLDAAIYAAWNVPETIRDEEGGEHVMTDAQGCAVTRPDLAALAKLLKLKAELRGLNAPSKSITLHGDLTPVAAMTPAERQAEIARLLARRQAALGPGVGTVDIAEKSE